MVGMSMKIDTYAYAYVSVVLDTVCGSLEETKFEKYHCSSYG